MIFEKIYKKFQEAKNDISLFETFSDVKYATEIIDSVADGFARNEIDIDEVSIFMDLVYGSGAELVSFNIKINDKNIKIILGVPMYRRHYVTLEISNEVDFYLNAKCPDLESALKLILSSL